ncbi:MAG: hypothetical protein U1D30_13130 [Planctomycetota bacterium]
MFLGCLLPTLAIVLAADGAAALPVRSLILYRNDTAWVERSGEIAVAEGTAQVAIDANAIPSTWSLSSVDMKQKPLTIVTTPFGPLPSLLLGEEGKPNRFYSGAWLTFRENDKTTTGELIGVERTRSGLQIYVRTASGLSLLPPRSLSSISRTAHPRATVSFPKDVTKAVVTTSSVVTGIGWRPIYRLDIGPEGQGRLRLTATIHNSSPDEFRTDKAECSLLVLDRAEPSAAASDPSGSDRTTYSVGSLVLKPLSDVAGNGTLMNATLAENDARVEQRFDWFVGGPDPRDGKTSIEDKVESVLVVTTGHAQSLSPGPIVVTQLERPLGASSFPYTPPRQPAEVRLGPTADLVVQREESELERKRNVAAGDDQPADWVVLSGVLTMENRGIAPARVRVTKRFAGEGTAASDGGRIQRVPNQIGPAHPMSEIVWDVTIPPGQAKRLTYGYQMVVPTK